jgi:hypothetical protein
MRSMAVNASRLAFAGKPRLPGSLAARADMFNNLPGSNAILTSAELHT